jgi:hypothetical protein
VRFEAGVVPRKGAAGLVRPDIFEEGPRRVDGVDDRLDRARVSEQDLAQRLQYLRVHEAARPYRLDPVGSLALVDGDKARDPAFDRLLEHDVCLVEAPLGPGFG